MIDDTINSVDLVEQVKKKIKKRKIGAVCRFVYDRAMPDDFLNFLVDAFRIRHEELVPGDKHLNLEDLRHLPNPNHSIPRIERPIPMKLNRLNDKESIFSYVEKKDLLLYYPYHSFDHFIHFLYEAVHNHKILQMISIFFVCTFQEQANCQVEPVVAQKRDYFVFGYRYRLQVSEYLFPEKVFYELLVERLYIAALIEDNVIFA